MEIIVLSNRSNISTDKNLSYIFTQFSALLDDVRKRDLAENIVLQINLAIDKINNSILEGKKLARFIELEQASILDNIEEEIGLVPKNHYRNHWISRGSMMFGIPIGILLGLSFGNKVLFGIGLPIGMILGVAYGIKLDKDAFKENKQLKVEV